jgi:fermentation-respiration switch protein FrsA (DUF1100 family)
MSSVARLIGRVAAIGAAAGCVALLAHLWLGPPTLTRAYQQNEVARFRPTAGHGVVQLAGETFLVCLCAYVGRRWLKIRL